MFDLSKYTLPLRIVELVLGLLVLALMSAVAHYFNIADEPAFLLFCVSISNQFRSLSFFISEIFFSFYYI